MIKDNRSSPFLPAVPLHRPMMAETMQKSLKSTSGLPQGYLRVKSGLSQGSGTTKTVCFTAE